ncbi:hypothetical protein SPSIL_013660 [Sporomusa silvacetica DSM 10669]|uniref:Uncharacterized protein n=1 Tax=Sporomusa silvacetica DSM 10669 TaxID=1123289 RepID=A0ABZ3IHU9_9FIRM|nr:hypothetical protein [Sporomusa silvacetica]OZC16760.1 hypothetical protein SPSIL_35970 [Sporomusa silvacetica DSM 10669]
MTRLFKCLFIVGIMLVCAVSSGFAASNWITMDERPTVVYQ